MSAFNFTVYDWAKQLDYLNTLLAMKWENFEELKNLTKTDCEEYCSLRYNSMQFIELLQDISDDNPKVFLEDDSRDKLNILACNVFEQVRLLSVINRIPWYSSDSVYNAFHPEN